MNADTPTPTPQPQQLQQQPALHPQAAQMQVIFNRMAPIYDAVGPGCFAHFGERLVAFAAAQPGEQVLDLATGRGACLLPAAAQVGPSGLVVGVDVADEMLRLTQAAVTEQRITTTVNLQIMDAEHLTFEDRAFHLALCGFGLMFLANPAAALAGIRRVLHPAGRLALSTWRITQTRDLHSVLHDLGFIPDADEAVERLGDAALIEQLLTEAGYSGIRTQVEPASFTFATLDAYWATAMGTGISRHVAALDAEQKLAVTTALQQRLPADSAGRVTIHSEALFAVAYVPALA